MGRIVTAVKIENALDPSRKIEVDAVVDVDAYIMTLPDAWRDKLGELPVSRQITVGGPGERTSAGEICGPVYVQIAGFRRIASEVLFTEMKRLAGEYQPAIGHITLEQSQAAVDNANQRLIQIPIRV